MSLQKNTTLKKTVSIPEQVEKITLCCLSCDDKIEHMIHDPYFQSVVEIYCDECGITSEFKFV